MIGRVSVAVLGLLAAMGTGAAYAQAFQHEATPLIENCGDPSYEKAKSEGIIVGISPSPPFTSLNPDTQKAEGLEVEIDEAALKWAGIGNIKYEVMPFGQLIPALIAKRIDMVAALHITPDRSKVVSFSGPAYWYGPAILVQKGNPDGIKSYDDLKGKPVGAIAGSAADEYLRKIGAEIVPFQTDAEQFSAVATGRVSAVVDDDTKINLFLAENKDSPMELLAGVKVPDELIFQYGYGYVRPGFRKEDCSLRVAVSQGLAEVRGNGEVLALLKKYGFSAANLFFYPLD
ncbi:transporter substrate-binding domain-containing protein [Rhodoligotrophos defluvii]|uniref:transporter substrate-binding domain-containing protein n=1 Tax=Rhodoligotrophos defluvii TaxID=2561934 RepID=UPI0010CA0919|nr:transporter substrate-binding domain-containing protein [Rhodoligotrophos defluvii]